MGVGVIPFNKEWTVDLKELQRRAHEHAITKGFWDEAERPELVTEDGIPTMVPTVSEKLCLVHSEVSEALEDYRRAQDITDLQLTRFEEGGKPVGFPTELADIVIRVADLAEQLGIDLDQEVQLKMVYNRTREWKHGGKNL